MSHLGRQDIMKFCLMCSSHFFLSTYRRTYLFYDCQKHQRMIVPFTAAGILDDKDVPFAFNESFFTIAGKLRSKIHINNDLDPLSYLTRFNDNTIFLSSTCSDQV